MSRTKYLLLRAKFAFIALVNPWAVARELRKENEKLCATITNPLLTGISIGNGSIDIGLEGGAASLMAGMFIGMFEKYPDAKNYIEVEFGSSIGPITVTVQKKYGKSPHQLLKEAEQRLADLANGVSK